MTDKEMKVERYREENKTAEKGKVVFAGSSLMEMFPINKLLKEHNDDTVIYNRGVGGFLSDELLNVIDVCAVDLAPSKLFINIGTNDLSWSGIPISDLMAYYPVNFEAASEEMKECLKIRTNEKITAANAEVKKLAEKHGQRYIDINKNLKDEQGRLIQNTN